MPKNDALELNWLTLARDKLIQLNVHLGGWTTGDKRLLEALITRVEDLQQELDAWNCCARCAHPKAIHGIDPTLTDLSCCYNLNTDYPCECKQYQSVVEYLLADRDAKIAALEAELKPLRELRDMVLNPEVYYVPDIKRFLGAKARESRSR